MAQYNEILVGRFNRFLQKFLQMKGQAPSPQVATEWAPGFSYPLESDVWYPLGWDSFSGVASQAAVAAQPSGIRLRNPASSNVIAIIDSLSFASSLADGGISLAAGTAAADLATVQTPFGLDGRSRPRSTLFLSNTTNPGALTGTIAIYSIPIAAAPAMVELIQHTNVQIILTPGSAIQLQNSVVNSTLTANFRWRERFLEESERS